mmetsp:Transcript_138294/g.311628  ORF Transcript_138294/g.311628 Transcript_138294/m.311628 type:complete len:118 (-) Transcript_138294:82-435(-)
MGLALVASQGRGSGPSETALHLDPQCQCPCLNVPGLVILGPLPRPDGSSPSHAPQHPEKLEVPSSLLEMLRADCQAQPRRQVKGLYGVYEVVAVGSIAQCSRHLLRQIWQKEKQLRP